MLIKLKITQRTKQDSKYALTTNTTHLHNVCENIWVKSIIKGYNDLRISYLPAILVHWLLLMQLVIAKSTTIPPFSMIMRPKLHYNVSTLISYEVGLCNHHNYKKNDGNSDVNCKYEIRSDWEKDTQFLRLTKTFDLPMCHIRY